MSNRFISIYFLSLSFLTKTIMQIITVAFQAKTDNSDQDSRLARFRKVTIKIHFLFSATGLAHAMLSFIPDVKGQRSYFTVLPIDGADICVF